MLERTRELAEANALLERKIAETERAERLKTTLYRISEIANTAKNLDEFYIAMHDIMRELMYAENLYIALLNEARTDLKFVYIKDEKHPESPGTLSLDYLRGDATRPSSFTAKVLDSATPLLIRQSDMPSSSGGQGPRAYAWLGAPLKKDEITVGIIAVQSYLPTIDYSEADKELLTFVSQHISAAIHRKQSAELIKKAHAELQKINDELEQRVAQRTEELESVHKRLLEIAHQAGMSEIATGILHNLGNILNSINTSSSRLIGIAKQSKLTSLQRLNALLDEHQENLFEFLQNDPKGQQVLRFYKLIGEQLGEESNNVIQHAETIRKGVETIAAVISTQQKYAKGHLYKEALNPATLLDDALAILKESLHSHGIQVIRNYTAKNSIMAQKSQLLNVFVNLIKNAKEAMDNNPPDNRQLQLNIIDQADGVEIRIVDNGCGIAAEHLPKIFTHGFSTKKTGHGFGLHSCANYIKELGGHITVTSDGPNQGAVFTVSIPREAIP